MQNPDLFPQHLQDPDLISPGSADRLLSPGSATVVVRNPDLVSRHHKISPGSATVVVAKPGLDILAPKSVTKIGPCNELLSRGSATVVVRNPDLASRHPQISPGSATVVVRNPDLKNSLLEPGLIKSG